MKPVHVLLEGHVHQAKLPVVQRLESKSVEAWL